MFSRIGVAALVAVGLYASSSSALPIAPVKPVCARLFTVGHADTFARDHFRNGKISRHDLKRFRVLIRCQHSSHQSQLVNRYTNGLIKSQLRPWSHTGASIFGGACEYGHTGYRGDNLDSHPDTFAELGNGSALGGLPYMAKVEFKTADGRILVAYKRDIGGGGGSVGGYTRSFDLYQPFASKLAGAGCNWTGVVTYRIG